MLLDGTDSPLGKVHNLILNLNHSYFGSGMGLNLDTSTAHLTSAFSEYLPQHQQQQQLLHFLTASSSSSAWASSLSCTFHRPRPFYTDAEKVLTTGSGSDSSSSGGLDVEGFGCGGG